MKALGHCCLELAGGILPSEEQAAKLVHPFVCMEQIKILTGLIQWHLPIAVSQTLRVW